MKRLSALILSVVLMLLMFSSCSEHKEENGANTVERPVPEAKYNPHSLDAGRIKNSLNTSDLWYPDGGDGHVYVYFNHTDDEFHLTYSNHSQETKLHCTVSEDNHLISEKSDDIQFDIAFYDAFTFYDYNSKCWYSRGDMNEIKSAFIGKTLAEMKDNSNLYVFNEDGTCTETYKGSENKGTWSITASTAMVITFGGYSYTYDIDFDSEGNISGISQRGGRSFDIVD